MATTPTPNRSYGHIDSELGRMYARMEDERLDSLLDAVKSQPISSSAAGAAGQPAVPANETAAGTKVPPDDSGFKAFINPSKGEKQKDFISRCMGDKTMNSEYPDQKQRAAVCYSYWRRSKSKAK